jgi:hypothetical protein
MKTRITVNLTADDLFELARIKNPNILTGASAASVVVIGRTGTQLDEKEIRSTVRGSNIAAEVNFEIQ